ncbi:MAG: hypothetical protein HFE66_01355 [Clostridiales bacterium]|jgi:phosphoesterase RecJ-like protein|nr:hypothetical protein [Clostridiales bacterium]
MTSKTDFFPKLDTSAVCDLMEQYISARKKLLLLCHVNPDGDTVGSAFAMQKLYSMLGGYARCACISDTPGYLKFLLLEQDSLIYTPNMENDFDAIWTIDVASPMQLGQLSFLADRVSLSIDHHENCTLFSPYYLDGKASATGELIFHIYNEWIQRKKITSNPTICRCIYAAISADTGSFQYSNTTPETFQIAAILLKTIQNDPNGEDTASIARRLHGCRTIEEMQAQKLVIERLQLACNGKLAYTCVSASLPEENGLSDFDFGGMVDIPRSVSGVLVGLAIKENKSNKGTFKISARSNCDIDVASILSSFGGGGHKRAAGATITAENCRKAAEKMIAAFTPAIQSYQKENEYETKR